MGEIIIVFKNIARIKSALPEVLHIVMFYNSGIVFQTTFEQDINIPKLGENLAAFLDHIKNVYEICNFKFDDYNKLIFETKEISVIFLKLGEDSNIALFFKKEEDGDLKLNSIKRYINRIEELIDMDEKGIILQEILDKEEQIKNIRNLLDSKGFYKENLQKQLKTIDPKEHQEELKNQEKEFISLEEECIKLEKEINKYNEEILQLRKLIESDKGN